VENPAAVWAGHPSTFDNLRRRKTGVFFFAYNVPSTRETGQSTSLGDRASRRIVVTRLSATLGRSHRKDGAAYDPLEASGTSFPFRETGPLLQERRTHVYDRIASFPPQSFWWRLLTIRQPQPSYGEIRSRSTPPSRRPSFHKFDYIFKGESIASAISIAFRARRPRASISSKDCPGTGFPSTA